VSDKLLNRILLVHALLLIAVLAYLEVDVGVLVTVVAVVFGAGVTRAVMQRKKAPEADDNAPSP
jgi:hypothetical protein